MWQRKTHERTVQEIAHRLSVAPSTVSRIVDRFDRTWSVLETLLRVVTTSYHIAEVTCTVRVCKYFKAARLSGCVVA